MDRFSDNSVRGGRLEIHGMPLKFLIMAAYDVSHEAMISNEPGWIETQRYDLVAKAPPGTDRPMERLMLQSLLEDRLHLVIHREVRTLPVYALVIDKAGPQLKPAIGSGQGACAPSFGDGVLNRTCEHMTIPELIRQLSVMARTQLDKPIVDATGLTEAYDFKMTWRIPLGNILDGLSGIGLKLQSRKQPVSVVVIDRVERDPLNP